MEASYEMLLLLLVFLQLQSGKSDWDIPQCPVVHCSGTRIQDNMGVLEFCLPRFMRSRRQFGEHGDVHYEIKVRRHGIDFELRIVSGLYFPGGRPDWGSGWNVRRWRCPEMGGEDYYSIQDRLHSRYVTLNVPMGYAYYKDAPANVASQFDAVLDSLCWSKFRIQKR
jgi:hypothetical protein